jgi:hypothetical protein
MAMALVAVAATRPAAQAPALPATGAPQPGIYLDPSGTGAPASLVRIRANRAQELKTKGILKSMVSQGFTKPTFAAELSGSMADVRQAEGDLFFYIYFDTGNHAASGADLTSMMDAMSGGADALPAEARTGEDFILIQLAPGAHAREAALGEITNSAKSKASIDCTSERLAQGAYRLRPKSALKPGEYAFYFATKMGGAPSMQLWDFGIDAKAKSSH